MSGMEHSSECHVTYLFTISCHGPYSSGVRVIHIVRRSIIAGNRTTSESQKKGICLWRPVS